MPVGDTPAGTSEADAGKTIASMFDDTMNIGANTAPKLDTEEQKTDEEGNATPDPEQGEDTGAEANKEDGANEDPDHTEALPSKRKLTLSDGVEVDEDEAIKGYLRQSDYTKKTQALAEARKKLEQEELPAVQKERQEYAATLTELRKLVEANTPREPNWEKLKAELPPGEYAAKWVEWDQHQKHLADLKQVEQAATAKVQQDAVSRQNANAQAAFERTLELIPEWKDETKGKAERQAIVEYAGTLGFTQQDLASITRPELMVVLRDAARYHTLQANAKNPPKNVKPAAAVLKPGGANERVRPPSSDLEKAVKNLKRTGSERDAASAIRNLPGLNL